MRKKKAAFYFNNIEITKRELLVSVAIAAILLLIGFIIHGKISDYILDRNEKYNKALKIESQELFEYGMRTNAGTAFVYGEYRACDPVTYPEIGGQYMYIEKVKERYTQHWRTVTHTKTVNGKTTTYTTQEPYWTWDRVGSEDKRCTEVLFCGVIFDAEKIETPNTYHIDTIYESSRVRYVYCGTAAEYKGTIFTRLADNTISDRSPFYESGIAETVEHCEINLPLWVFWIVWALLMVGCLYGFFYMGNRWLE